MRSTPTSSSFSSSPFTASSSSKFVSELPVMILENRVTLIVGETGCGKSSQIPQFLLEEKLEPILCTQPRRFAVVAVAIMVARARNCEVGGEMRMQLAEYASSGENVYSYNNGYHVAGGASMCRLFVSGSCKWGGQCFFCHSLQSKKPACKFVFSLKGFCFGESCLFSHDSASSTVSGSDTSLCCPEDEEIDANSLLRLFPVSDGCILLLDDVEKLGRDSFFFLKDSFPFDESIFGELFDEVRTKKAMLTSKAVSYVFQLHPPAYTQSSDFAALL